MSFNRENVLWQSPDGTWNRGFWAVIYTGPGDPEWDVEYGDTFEWVTVGHPDEQSALEAWDGSNPGGHTVYSYPNEACERFDKLADECQVQGQRDSYNYRATVYVNYSY